MNVCSTTPNIVMTSSAFDRYQELPSSMHVVQAVFVVYSHGQRGIEFCWCHVCGGVSYLRDSEILCMSIRASINQLHGEMCAMSFIALL